MVAAAVQDAGLDRPVMVGHSIAAVIASVYATTYPCRGVVNVDQSLDTSFMRMLQQATLTVLPNSGHFPHLADPDHFAQLLAETGRWPGATGSAPR